MAVSVTRTRTPQLQVRLRGMAKPSLGPSESADQVCRKYLQSFLSPDSHSCSSAEPAPPAISETSLLVQLCAITLPLCLSVCNSSASLFDGTYEQTKCLECWGFSVRYFCHFFIDSRDLGKKPCRKRHGTTDSAQEGPGSLGTWNMKLLALERAQLIHINIQG